MGRQRLASLGKLQLIRLIQEKNLIIDRQAMVISRQSREIRALQGNRAIGDKCSEIYRQNLRVSETPRG